MKQNYGLFLQSKMQENRATLEKLKGLDEFNLITDVKQTQTSPYQFTPSPPLRADNKVIDYSSILDIPSTDQILKNNEV